VFCGVFPQGRALSAVLLACVVSGPLPNKKMVTKMRKTSCFAEVFNQQTQQWDRGYRKRGSLRKLTFYLKTVVAGFVGLKSGGGWLRVKI